MSDTYRPIATPGPAITPGPDTYRPIDLPSTATVTPGTPTNRPFGDRSIPFGITPNRKTRLIVDEVSFELSEQAFTLERSCAEIARTTPNRRNRNLFNLLSVDAGIKVNNYWYDPSTVVERDEASSSWLSSANCLIHSAFEFVDEWREAPASLMLGVATDASSHKVATGGKRLRKKVAAGATWINKLVDSFVFPEGGVGNFTTDNTYKMDTCLVSNNTDNAYQDLHIEFYVPSGVADGAQKMYQVAFNGPATGKSAKDNGAMVSGTGKYCLDIYGRGKCELHELLVDNTWIIRDSFRYNSDSNNNTLYVIDIHKFYLDPARHGSNGKLVFTFSSNVGESLKGGGTDVFGKTSSLRTLSNTSPSYTASCDSITRTATQDSAIRVAMRRDLRGAIGIAVSKKPTTTVELQDDPFCLPFIPRDLPHPYTQPETHLVWDYILPPGISGTVECKLFKYSDNTECTLISTISGTHKTYNLAFDQNCYYVKIYVTTDGKTSPIFKGYRLQRAAVYHEESYAGAPEEIEYVRGVNITGAERDPKLSSAKVMVTDAWDQHSILRTRGSMPIRVEIESDPVTDPSKRCILFRGYTKRITAQRRMKMVNRDVTAGVPFYNYQIDAVGMYQRLREQVSSYNAPMYDMITGNPFKVTDVITQFLQSSGIPPSMYDIPNLPVRMYSVGGGFHEQIDALTELGEGLLTLIDQYLTHYLWWDDNAGAFGKWRLLSPPTSPYTNVAQFVFDSSGIGDGLIVETSYQAYANYSKANIPTTFIKRNSFKSWVKPPETNLLIVSCMGKTTPTNDMPHQWFQVFPNFKSADFGNGLVDNTSPDYLGRIIPMYVMLPQFASIPLKYNSTLNMWEHPALNFVGRRVFDLAAHAIKTCTFEAPLLLIPHESDGTRSRTLRYYDPVLVNGEQFLIRNVNPSYMKDHVQMAIYECEAPRI